MVDSRLKNWNTKPTCLRRSTAHADGGQPVDPLPAQPDLAARGGLKAAEHVQQRGLARAGRPHDRHELADADVQVDSADGLDGHAAGLVHLDEPAGAQQGRHILGRRQLGVLVLRVSQESPVEDADPDREGNWRPT